MEEPQVFQKDEHRGDAGLTLAAMSDGDDVACTGDVSTQAAISPGLARFRNEAADLERQM